MKRRSIFNLSNEEVAYLANAFEWLRKLSAAYTQGGLTACGEEVNKLFVLTELKGCHRALMIFDEAHRRNVNDVLERLPYPSRTKGRIDYTTAPPDDGTTPPTADDKEEAARKGHL